jgi:hypothetical protein
VGHPLAVISEHGGAPGGGSSKQRRQHVDEVGGLVMGFAFFVFPDSFSQAGMVSACENIDFHRWALHPPR